MFPKVSIIILNWNGWKDTIECLESLYQINYPNYNVVIVDNHSEDDSVDKIKNYCKGKIRVKSNFYTEYISTSKPIKVFEYTRKKSEDNQKDVIVFSNKDLIIIKNDENAGFAEGNNIGIRYALKTLKSEYVLLLNNDTIVDKNFLDELIKVGESNNKIGIVGSKIYFYDNPNQIQSEGFNINWYRGEVKPLYNKNGSTKQEIYEVDAVSGCSMLIKKEVFSKINLLDKNIYLYYEDTDFCVRAKKSGYQIFNTSYSLLWHKSGVSSKKINGTLEYYSARNLFSFMKKYANKKQFYCFLLYFFCFKFWFTSLVIVIYHKEPSAFIPFVKGVWNGLRL